MKITYRKATKEDMDYLFVLRKESMTPHIEAVGLIYDDAEDINRIEYRFDCAKIILVDGVISGLIKVVEEGNEWDLIQIQIDSFLRGQGIGKRVIADILERAFSNGASVKLSVLRSNPAKELYEMLGFKLYLVTPTTYEMCATN
ncbi:MAG: GNAT family N-acetyltransferase [Oceanospirillaceae bacterium]|nr:GNAT family N-acetyltransferase [Oceanospirillaceae bacterium]